MRRDRGECSGLPSHAEQEAARARRSIRLAQSGAFRGPMPAQLADFIERQQIDLERAEERIKRERAREGESDGDA